MKAKHLILIAVAFAIGYLVGQMGNKPNQSEAASNPAHTADKSEVVKSKQDLEVVESALLAKDQELEALQVEVERLRVVVEQAIIQRGKRLKEWEREQKADIKELTLEIGFSKDVEQRIYDEQFNSLHIDLGNEQYLHVKSGEVSDERPYFESWTRDGYFMYSSLKDLSRFFADDSEALEKYRAYKQEANRRHAASIARDTVDDKLTKVEGITEEQRNQIYEKLYYKSLERINDDGIWLIETTEDSQALLVEYGAEYVDLYLEAHFADFINSTTGILTDGQIKTYIQQQIEMRKIYNSE